MISMVSEKIKIRPRKTQLDVFESFLTIYIWNTGLFSIELFISTNKVPNKSYFWFRDEWGFKQKSGSLRDLSHMVLMGIFEELKTNVILREDFILTPEPNMYFLKYYPSFHKPESTNHFFISKFKSANNKLRSNWFELNFENFDRILFFNPSRGYFFLQDSNRQSLQKQLRQGLLFTIQFIIGYHYWLNYPKIESLLTSKPTFELINFFLMNLNPEKLSNNFISPFRIQPYFSFLKTYLEYSTFSNDYSLLEKQISSKIFLLNAKSRDEWQKATNVLNSGIISEKFESLQKTVITDEYHFVKSNPMLLFSFAVAVELFQEAQRNAINPSDRKHKSEVTTHLLVKKSKELAEKKKNAQELPYPYSELTIISFSSKTLNSEKPLLKLYQKDFLEASERRRGRPIYGIQEPGIFYLHPNWTNRDKLNTFFKL